MSASNGSITDEHRKGGYSADVRLYLQRNGERLPLAQVGRDRLYFDEPVEIEPGPAAVVVEIDGEEKSRSVLIRASIGPVRVIECDSA